MVYKPQNPKCSIKGSLQSWSLGAHKYCVVIVRQLRDNQHHAHCTTVLLMQLCISEYYSLLGDSETQLYFPHFFWNIIPTFLMIKCYNICDISVQYQYIKTDLKYKLNRAEIWIRKTYQTKQKHAVILTYSKTLLLILIKFFLRGSFDFAI